MSGNQPVYCSLCGLHFDSVANGYAHLKAMRRSKNRQHQRAIANPTGNFLRQRPATLEDRET